MGSKQSVELKVGEEIAKENYDDNAHGDENGVRAGCEEEGKEDNDLKEMRKKAKTNSGIGIASGVSFASLGLSELTMKSIADIGFECMTEAEELKHLKFAQINGADTFCGRRAF